MLSLVSPPQVKAQGLVPVAAFAQAGVGQDELSSATIGVQWAPFWSNASGALTAYADAYASRWRARDVGGGHKGFTLLALTPMLRYHFDDGRSPWFVEGGIGVSLASPRYVTASKVFGSKFNFTDNLALGRSFGNGARHEVSLRLQHLSNANIKKPNPGEEFVQLRYALGF